MSRLNPGRLAALRVLVAVEEGGHAEDLLALAAPGGEPDRSLAWHLVLGVLRRQGTLDAWLAPWLKRGVAELDAPVRASLRIGAFELGMSRTRPHAAVDQAVEACRRAGAPRARGLVNAVLRKAAATALPQDPWLDLPEWLRARWAGFDAWVPRLREPPPICGAWKDRPLAALARRPAFAGGERVPATFRLEDPRGPVPEMPGFAQGAWWVMDPAAARVADLSWEAARPAPAPGTTRVLDACAAPGGKSFRLASCGALVTAVDLSPGRLALVEEGACRLGFAVATTAHDWLAGPCPALPRDFDVVLVDAPCTGLGTVRRHPEIRWRRLPSDPAAMAFRQLPILRAAAEHVCPGGALVYAVCSTEPEEGPGVVDAFTATGAWRVEDRWSTVPPHADEDAFQAFVLRRG